MVGLDRRCEPWGPDERRLERDLEGPHGLAGLAPLMLDRGYRYVVADPTFARRLYDAGGDPATAFERLRRTEGLTTVVDRSDGAETFLLLAAPRRPD